MRALLYEEGVDCVYYIYLSMFVFQAVSLIFSDLPIFLLGYIFLLVFVTYMIASTDSRPRVAIDPPPASESEAASHPKPTTLA